MNGFERRKKQKQQDIQSATLKLFNQYGPSGMNIAKIAKAAKVSQVTIYNHFENKEQLIRETIKAYLMEQFELYEQLLLSNSTFETKLKNIMFEKAKSFKTINPQFLQELILQDEPLQRWFHSFYSEQSLPLLIKFIKTSQQKGEINPELSVDTILFYIQALKTQLDQLAPHEIATFDKNKSLEILHIFFKGISPN
ncbi:TetR/AcrR family transcriptional regulator [Priestia flexa]|jgi:AcrR family transcriptional regulator|uniref:TetR/AcrR family transcriptional regulator n=1 Tax=Priestia flexa TaxID=86664 RepID=UPI001A8C8F8A|nr:TetR/AcrR family transcriptional regulator [Priestia flexa]MBN8435814.1 TetR/AcrR family transcriptional regulator [Priestia flexa]MCA0968371.1 TetR/AcrR family transcriptional regulator [Priestia flexa]UIR28428.1 TetR/AcrR family transcriptional regulator [Priestia flexa]